MHINRFCFVNADAYIIFNFFVFFFPNWDWVSGVKFMYAVINLKKGIVINFRNDTWYIFSLFKCQAWFSIINQWLLACNKDCLSLNWIYILFEVESYELITFSPFTISSLNSSEI